MNPSLSEYCAGNFSDIINNYYSENEIIKILNNINKIDRHKLKNSSVDAFVTYVKLANKFHEKMKDYMIKKSEYEKEKIDDARLGINKVRINQHQLCMLELNGLLHKMQLIFNSLDSDSFV